jgi:hypothetical protein
VIGGFRIEGYVIASADGMIADANGVMPRSLHHDADKRYFEAGLDHVEAVVHGRHSQEFQPKTLRRRRLILTRSVEALAPHPNNAHALLWNPAGTSFEKALRRARGGLRDDRRHRRAHGLRSVPKNGLRRLPSLPGGGRPSARRAASFHQEPVCGEPDVCLAAVGLRAGQTLWLGDEVTLTDWTGALYFRPLESRFGEIEPSLCSARPRSGFSCRSASAANSGYFGIGNPDPQELDALASGAETMMRSPRFNSLR